jgi:hypothetical protein
VFEERYRLLVNEKRDFGVVLIRRGREVGPGLGDDVHPVGTVATLQEVHALPDGRYYVVARGLDRFRIEALEHGRPYLRAWVQPLPEPPGPAAGARLLHLLGRYLGLRGLDLPPELTSASGQRLVWIVGSLLESEPGTRQELLEKGEPRLAESMLTAEVAKLEALGELGSVPRRRPSPN